MSEIVAEFLYDANQFAVAFRDVIESIAHIYLLALPSVKRHQK